MSNDDGKTVEFLGNSIRRALRWLQRSIAKDMARPSLTLAQGARDADGDIILMSSDGFSLRVIRPSGVKTYEWADGKRLDFGASLMPVKGGYYVVEEGHAAQDFPSFEDVMPHLEDLNVKLVTVKLDVQMMAQMLNGLDDEFELSIYMRRIHWNQMRELTLPPLDLVMSEPIEVTGTIKQADADAYGLLMPKIYPRGSKRPTPWRPVFAAGRDDDEELADVDETHDDASGRAQ